VPLAGDSSVYTSPGRTTWTVSDTCQCQCNPRTFNSGNQGLSSADALLTDALISGCGHRPCRRGHPARGKTICIYIALHCRIGPDLAMQQKRGCTSSRHKSRYLMPRHDTRDPSCSQDTGEHITGRRTCDPSTRHSAELRLDSLTCADTFSGRSHHPRSPS